jgi:hypothetical protein
MEQNNGVIQESKNINKNFSLDKSSLLIIVLLFMFSSKLWDIAWDIGKSFLYIIIIIYLTSFINQELADNIKNIIHDFTNVNSNNNIITDLLAKLSGSIKSILNFAQTEKTSASKVTPETIQSEQKVEKFETTTHTSLYDGTGYLSGGNTKNLSNIARSDSKNIFA